MRYFANEYTFVPVARTSFLHKLCRYISAQRFRSTTAKVSEVPATASRLTSEKETTSPIKAEEYPKVSSSTVNATTISSSTTASPTSTSTEVITVISVGPSGDPSTVNSTTAGIATIIADADAVTSATAAVGSTTESVKLVDDSATEILLTTVPASSSSSSSSSSSQSTTTTTSASRTTIATVSQPRPFGFVRRRPSSSDAATTTATIPSSNQARPGKVSITSRNPTRPSGPYLGRVRPRPTRPAEDQADPARAETYASRGKDSGRTRNRGSNRYTPPTPRSRSDDAIANSVPGRYRERGRISTTTTASAAGGDFRRRYRRPVRTSSTESPRTNELDDSPIIRITQGGARRYQSLRSRSEGADGSDERITNIRIFRRPAAVNRELYDRTRYTKTRNDAELGERTGKWTTVPINVTAKIDDGIERNESSNVVVGDGDRNDAVDVTTIDSAVESNTVDPTYTLGPFVETDVTTVPGDKIDHTSVRPEVASAAPVATTTTTVRVDDLRDNPPIIVATERAAVDVASDAPRRRKVVLRRRPVSSPSTAANDAVDVEDERGSQVGARRRKVIKRVRPLSNVSSTPLLSSTETVRETEEAGKISSPPPESTAPTTRGEVAGSTLPIVLGRTEMTEDSTPTDFTETTLYANRGDLDDGFTRVTLEVPAPESTTRSGRERATDFLISVTASTLDDEPDDEYRSTSVEDASLESTLGTSASTEDASLDETLVPFTVPENLPVTRARITTHPPNSSPVAKLRSESRYARNKFLRKSPVVSSDNATDLLSSVSSSSTENGSFERRTDNSFARRQSTFSTSSDEDLFKYETVDDDSRDISAAQGVTAEGIPGSDESATTNARLKNDFTEFWRRYTPTSSAAQRSYSTVRAENAESDVASGTELVTQDAYRSTSATTRKSEIRPRYRVPVIVKRPFDPEEALSWPRRFHPFDSAPEESEDTPTTGYRQPRTRYKPRQGNARTDEYPDATTSSPEATTLPYHYRTRPYLRRTSTTSTEAAVTETLIPARKFDYAADAVHRKQQAMRTTTTTTSTTGAPRRDDTLFDSQNLIDTDYSGGSTTSKPLVTRLVTSVTESGTTERQRILIKTKYSSLTSTTWLPADYFTPTTPSSPGDDESVNEIRPGVERSTLPIESEFNYRRGSRFATTEPYGSSTIEIESVFSNLIADRRAAK